MNEEKRELIIHQFCNMVAFGLTPIQAELVSERIIIEKNNTIKTIFEDIDPLLYNLLKKDPEYVINFYDKIKKKWGIK